MILVFQILAKKHDFLSVRCRPAFVGQYGQYYIFHLKSLNIGLLASYEPKTQNTIYKLKGKSKYVS